MNSPRCRNNTTVGDEGQELRDDVCAISNKHDRLGHGNLEAPAAARAGEHIIDADHVIAGLGKPGAVHFAGAARWGLLPGSFQPTNVIVGAFAAVRADKRSLLRFLLFVKKISLIHNSRLTSFSSVRGQFAHPRLDFLRFAVSADTRGHGDRRPQQVFNRVGQASRINRLWLEAVCTQGQRHNCLSGSPFSDGQNF